MVGRIEHAQEVDEPAPWAVHLPGFDGPMDLLLSLIERNQLEITTDLARRRHRPVRRLSRDVG